MPVPARENMDNETRQRFRRWRAWYRRTRYQDKTDQDLAKALGISGPILSTILSGTRTMGLDVFLKLQRVSGIPADILIGTDPPGQA